MANGGSIQRDANSVTTMTSADAGSSRRARRAQNAGSEIVPLRPSSASSSRVIRNPESTKKTSTPTKPPVNPATSAWNARTATTASARSPSTSARKPVGVTPSRARRTVRRRRTRGGAGSRMTQNTGPDRRAAVIPVVVACVDASDRARGERRGQPWPVEPGTSVAVQGRVQTAPRAGARLGQDGAGLAVADEHHPADAGQLLALDDVTVGQLDERPGRHVQAGLDDAVVTEADA